MDTNEAKFILSGFRPDGADAGTPEFADALRLAAEDRALGEWLAVERSRDADFARALMGLPLPGDLKDAILASLAAGRGEEPERDRLDGAFAEALAAVVPPPGWRGEVLLAMRASAPRWSGWKFAVPFAAAAGIVLALALTREEPSSPGVAAAAVAGGALPVAHVRAAAMELIESPDFRFDLEASDHRVLFEHLRRHRRACAGGCLPKGLRDFPGLGCRTLEIDGRPGALVCFLRGPEDMVHLVIFRRGDVEDAEPEGAAPRIERHGEWSVARWAEKGRVFLLMGHSEAGGLGELF